MVVAARADEQQVAGGAPAWDLARLSDDVEAQDPDVEVADAVDVGRAQVDVADPHARVDGALAALHRCDVALGGHAPGSTARGGAGERPPPARTCAPPRGSRTPSPRRPCPGPGAPRAPAR